jgi:ligand-binding SRPBCC domain-containing protein
MPTRPHNPRRFEFETRLAAPPEVVFRFHEALDALTFLTPPWESLRRVEGGGNILPGTRVVLKGRLLGLIPARWVEVHTVYEPPTLFEDVQETGPFAYWRHRHRFLDDGDGGTIMRDEIDYVPPLGWLGRLFGDPIIRARLKRNFGYRHEKVRQILETPTEFPTV